MKRELTGSGEAVDRVGGLFLLAPYDSIAFCTDNQHVYALCTRSNDVAD